MIESNAKKYLKKQRFNPDKCTVILQESSGLLQQINMVEFLDKFEIYVREQNVETLKNFAVSSICDLMFGNNDAVCDDFTRISEK